MASERTPLKEGLSIGASSSVNTTPLSSNLPQSRAVSSDDNRIDLSRFPVSQWNFLGWGSNITMDSEAPFNSNNNKLAISSNDDSCSMDDDVLFENYKANRGTSRLGVLQATAIVGCDVLSLCLYVSALVISHAGVWALLSMLCVGLTLLVFEGILWEVGSAVPFNGGGYSVLLNSTSKKRAVLAAILSLLTYITTAVLCASTAVHYLSSMVPSVVNHIVGSITLLATMGFLALLGIGNSSTISIIIFFIHLSLILMLFISVFIVLARGDGYFVRNFNLTFFNSENWLQGFLLGYAGGMLAVSGIESSVNIVEDLKPGAFPTTLRFITLISTTVNLMVVFFALSTVPISSQISFNDSILSLLGSHLGRIMSPNDDGFAISQWLRWCVCIDALVSLSGCVLTSFVGATGLISRLCFDGCLPAFILQRNKWTGARHWIILGFGFACVFVYLITMGDSLAIVGIYNMSFLCSLAVLAIANLILKIQCPYLPRRYTCGVPRVVGGLFMATFALALNIYVKPMALLYLMLGCSTASVPIFLLLFRAQCLRLTVKVLDSLDWACLNPLRDYLVTVWHGLNTYPVVFFAKGNETFEELSRLASYVIHNEQSRILKIVHFFSTPTPELSPDFDKSIRIIDSENVDLRIDLVMIRGYFGPSQVEKTCQLLRTPPNYMLMGIPCGRSNRMRSRAASVDSDLRLLIGECKEIQWLEEFRGVRLIA